MLSSVLSPSCVHGDTCNGFTITSDECDDQCASITRCDECLAETNCNYCASSARCRGRSCASAVASVDQCPIIIVDETTAPLPTQVSETSVNIATSVATDTESSQVGATKNETVINQTGSTATRLEILFYNLLIILALSLT